MRDSEHALVKSLTELMKKQGEVDRLINAIAHCVDEIYGGKDDRANYRVGIKRTVNDIRSVETGREILAQNTSGDENIKRGA